MKVSLKMKSVLMLLIVTLVLSGISLAVSYVFYKSTMEDYYQTHTMNLSKTEAVLLDKDQISELTNIVMDRYYAVCDEYGGTIEFDTFSDEEWNRYYAEYEDITESELYAEVLEVLQEFAKVNDVASVYVCYMDLKTNKAVYIIDGSLSEDICLTGTCDGIEADNLERMKQGDYNFPAYITNYEEYGWLCTASSAIVGPEQTVLANAYVDISMDDVVQNRMQFLLYLCALLFIAAAIMIGILSLFVNISVVKPINTLAQATGRFVSEKESHGNEEKASEIANLDISTGDELEHLAESIKKMEVEINDYIKNLTHVTAEKERIGAELDVAAHIQSAMLPSIFPAFPEREEFDIYATMNPAKEVGGDFYDFFMVDERHLAIVMADVSGKGVPAALFMVIGKTLIKDHTYPECDLGMVFTEVNNLLCESNSEGLFITAFEGVLDLVTGEFRFVNAGHEIPFICKKDNVYEPYKIKAGFVLGGMEGISYKTGTITLEPGDKIFQYTDGAPEATDMQNQLYGMERLEEILVKNSGKKPNELLPLVKEDIDKFVGAADQFDDITMLCLEYKARMEERAV